MKAQVSLEFLILVVAFSSMLLLFVPLAIQGYYYGLFGLDVLRAKTFCEEVQLAVSELSAFEEGSKRILFAEPIEEWFVFSENEKFFVLVKNSELRQEKKIEVELSNSLFAEEKTLKEKTMVLIENSNGKVSMEYN